MLYNKDKMLPVAAYNAFPGFIHNVHCKQLGKSITVQ